ncbi:MAG: helix-turn-helix domain-containing protein [Defluviitaleaceae bacterium]|nr:helix-turn-helix domain-containing protein [Defluviitaleaceae bacterium]
MKIEKNSVGERIRTERIKRKLTLNDLAKNLEISATYLGLIEMGKRGKNINVDLILKISKIFEVSIDYLFGLDFENTTKDDEEYRTLKIYYKMMKKEEKEQFISIAKILLKG